MTREIFISYSRRNLDKVKAIKTEIEQYTHKECWIDLEEIPSDVEDYLKKIVKGIENCQIFLFMLSKESQEADIAIGELLAAKEQKKKTGIHVVVVNIDDCEMKMEFIIRFSKLNIITWSKHPEKVLLLRDLTLWLESDNQQSETLELLKLFPVKISQKYGFADESGKLVIPCQWEDAGNFCEGLATVTDTNGKWGYIDNTGKVVISGQWEETSDYSEGLAAVKDTNEKWGYIDQTGKVVIPCLWTDAHSFVDGWADVWDEKGMCRGIDKTGKIIR